MNFALILFVLTVVTGALYAVDVLKFRKLRERKYASFYGLSSKPFLANPDAQFYFPSEAHLRATAYLEYGMQENEGFVVITGELGVGKTTIIRRMLDSLDPDKVIAAHLVSARGDADNTLRLVGTAFGIHTKGVDKSDVMHSLEAFLIGLTSKGKSCLLIVDEAQNLTSRAVEELRMLSNFQFESHALLQTFLVGQPEFRTIMLSPQMTQLRQRVIAGCHLGPLDQEDVGPYIQHRLKCAGGKGEPAFDAAAYDAVFTASAGIPRRINAICDRLLLMGFLSSKKAFTGADVEEVAAEINQGAVGVARASGKQQLISPSAIDAEFGKADLGELSLSELDADEAGQMIQVLSARGFAERMIRIERTMLRLERSNSMLLQILQKLVDAARAPPERKPVKK